LGLNFGKEAVKKKQFALNALPEEEKKQTLACL
jgi:hypothetical protein